MSVLEEMFLGIANVKISTQSTIDLFSVAHYCSLRFFHHIKGV